MSQWTAPAVRPWPRRSLRKMLSTSGHLTSRYPDDRCRFPGTRSIRKDSGAYRGPTPPRCPRLPRTARPGRWDDYDYGLTDLNGRGDTLVLAQADQTSLIDRMTEQIFKNQTDERTRLQFNEIPLTPASIRSAILFDTSTCDYRTVLPDIEVPMLICACPEKTRGAGTVAETWRTSSRTLR